MGKTYNKVIGLERILDRHMCGDRDRHAGFELRIADLERIVHAHVPEAEREQAEPPMPPNAGSSTVGVIGNTMCGSTNAYWQYMPTPRKSALEALQARVDAQEERIKELLAMIKRLQGESTPPCEHPRLYVYEDGDGTGQTLCECCNTVLER